MAFPVGFGWGAATAAYQVEGGWDADGRGPCVWDTFTHQGGERVFENQTGDVACGSYTLWEEDLKCIKQLGLTHYRFSLSWSRLLPDGTTGFINQKGIDYYNKIIDDLLKNGVTPIVAIYHFDLPQALEDQGGWLSEAIVEVFDKYAQFCFRTFGDRVKQWLTINEPNTLAILAYDMGIFAPGVPHFGTGGYQAAHNLIKAHARSWHSYDDLFRKEQKGFVSLPLFFCWLEPSDPNSVLDQEATKRAINFQLDFFAKPIFIDGDYPELVKSQIATMSKKQGYSSSRLPEFTEEEKKMIKGTADFFAVQYYTTRLVRHQENKKGELSFLQDVEIEFFPNPSWENVGWIYVVPWGIRKLLKYIKDTYNNPVIYITENGFPQCDPPSLDDTQRWEYFRQTFQELFKAIHVDEVNLQVYCAWSLLDNFEWNNGYSRRFGLFHVDFEDPARPRVPYKSAMEYAKVIRNNGLEGPL
ncbi:cytosolic beta-glucosidase [Cricetulus griseus]|uniref:Cytosolic beta-glucosidase n=1 Tax=Cricetulus griseus TaxID=10029 RepID=A0A8C2QDM2_CRIGR|nr:cytosolic beta-glucosidase [Cricetulus griseus]XP_035308779.1 cytosolic beta-glucosidase [Cricetulus griseus]